VLFTNLSPALLSPGSALLTLEVMSMKRLVSIPPESAEKLKKEKQTRLGYQRRRPGLGQKSPVRRSLWWHSTRWDRYALILIERICKAGASISGGMIPAK
jgi:hypothetical protein